MNTIAANTLLKITVRLSIGAIASLIYEVKIGDELPVYTDYGSTNTNIYQTSSSYTLKTPGLSGFLIETNLGRDRIL